MNKIKVQEDIIYNKYAIDSIKIIHLADIHFNINIKEKKLRLISNYINSENADYIIITGDIVDNANITNNKEKIKELTAFFQDIARNNKVIISLGNHDVVLDCREYFNKLNKIKNIYVLDNDTYQDDYVYINGLTLSGDFYYDKSSRESIKKLKKYLDEYSKLVNNLPARKIKIALIHSPIKLTNDDVLDKLSEYDLILSGHTHDGMVPEILKPFFGKNAGIVSPYKQIFPKIARGKIVKKLNDHELTIIITGGITKMSLVSTKWLSKFNFIYNIGINRIIVKRKEV